MQHDLPDIKGSLLHRTFLAGTDQGVVARQEALVPHCLKEFKTRCGYVPFPQAPTNAL